jgi:hypothetical protein
MNLALTSDTHGHLPEIPKGAEGLIHAGDVCPDGTPDYQARWLVQEFYPWVERLGIPVWLTWGNHDSVGQRLHFDRLYSEAVTVARAYCPDNLKFLVDELDIINGKKVWFTPWSGVCGTWAWQRPDTPGGLGAIYGEIPEDVDIVVSHTPPHGRCDLNYDYVHIGSEMLRIRLGHTKVKTVICGHCHEAYGFFYGNGATYDVLNVANKDNRYRNTQEPLLWNV